MAEEEILEPDTFDTEESEQNMEELQKNMEALSDFYKDNAKEANTESYKALKQQKVKAVMDANIKFLKSLAKQNKKDFPDSDQTIDDFNRGVTELIARPIGDPATIKAGNAAESSLSSRFKTFVRASFKSVSNLFRSNKIKGLSSDTISKLNPELDISEQLATRLKNLIESPNPDSTEIQKASDAYKAQSQKISDLLETDSASKSKVTEKEGSTGWKVFKAIIGLLGLFAVPISIWVALKLAADALTGCYIFYDNNGVADKFLLSNCTDYYSKNQGDCSCRGLVNIGSPPLNPPDCVKLGAIKDNPNGDECTAPYCLGRCGGTPPPSICTNFPNGYLQCTQGSMKDSGYVSYAYEEYTPLSLVANAINAISNFVADTEDAISKFFKGIGKYWWVFLLVIIGIIILFGLAKRFIFKSKK